MSYCKYCSQLPLDNIHRIYHDNIYGIKPKSDNEMFERLSLEILQAGLSWDVVLKKIENIKTAFDNFDIATVSSYEDKKISDLMKNKNIICNNLKIQSIVHNAKEILKIQNNHGGFIIWFDHLNCTNIFEYTKELKKIFKFIGPKIIEEFLKSCGYIKTHDDNCYIKSA